MYITVNEHKYDNIKRQVKPLEIVYTGASLTGILDISGAIETYANNDFLLASDTIADYARYVISDGIITLTDKPEPVPPEPDPPEPPEPDIWDDIAGAIKEGVNGVD